MTQLAARGSRKLSRFALYFGNRGFFPGSLMEAARTEVAQVLSDLGHETIMMDASATRFGAVETPKEGAIFAEWLRQNRGKFDGVIMSLPNFGDETGGVAALKEAGVPIFIQAYPDELERMGNATRRDAFCGKCSMMDVFYQNGMKFTALKPHTVSPRSPRFVANIDQFDRTCRVVAGMKNMVVGAIGARTSAFKTVRIDEVALQRAGITMETMDLSEVLFRMDDVCEAGDAYIQKEAQLANYANFSLVPEAKLDLIVRLAVVLDEIIEELALDALALRCWVELQKQLGISPCVILSLLNNQGFAASCEVDVGNAVAMHALGLASGNDTACLDWNNNYPGEENDGDGDDNKCILFHCGPVPRSMMTARGLVTTHEILDNACGEGCGHGCNTGRIAPTPFTFGSMMTTEGRLRWYVGEGWFTDDPIPANFFGCAGVAEVENLQDIMLHVGYNGHRHHVSVTPGKNLITPLGDALAYYLDWEVYAPQRA